MLTISSSVTLWISWLRLCCHVLLCARCSVMSVQLAWQHWCRSKCIFSDWHLQQHTSRNIHISRQTRCLFCLFVFLYCFGITVCTSVWSSLQQLEGSLGGQQSQKKKCKHFRYQCWLESDHLFPVWTKKKNKISPLYMCAKHIQYRLIWMVVYSQQQPPQSGSDGSPWGKQ